MHSCVSVLTHSSFHLEFTAVCFCESQRVGKCIKPTSGPQKVFLQLWPTENHLLLCAMHSVEGSLTAQEWQCLNSPVAIADNFVYLTRISLGHDRAEKATDRKLTLNTAVRFFFFFITTQILLRTYLKMKNL